MSSKLVDLQELIARGRFAFSGAPKRFEVFMSVNGQASSKDIARKSRRPLTPVLDDLAMLVDMELIQEKRTSDDTVIKKDGATVFEKTPLSKHIPASFFKAIADTTKLVVKTPGGRTAIRNQTRTHIPSESEILDICRVGEDQQYEFKAAGVDTDKIAKEVSGFLHTKMGGVIFYGIDDDGAIIGSDVRRQDYDQRIQNSVRNTISPPPSVEVHERKPMGASVLLIVVPPWDGSTIYQNTKDGRYYIRRGTNIFALRPEEIRKLSKGTHVV